MRALIVSILVIYQGNKSILQPVITLILLKRNPTLIQGKSGIIKITKMGIPITTINILVIFISVTH